MSIKISIIVAISIFIIVTISGLAIGTSRRKSLSIPGFIDYTDTDQLLKFSFSPYTPFTILSLFMVTVFVVSIFLKLSVKKF